jgi:hypothetical protein
MLVNHEGEVCKLKDSIAAVTDIQDIVESVWLSVGSDSRETA